MLIPNNTFILHENQFLIVNISKYECNSLRFLLDFDLILVKCTFLSEEKIFSKSSTSFSSLFNGASLDVWIKTLALNLKEEIGLPAEGLDF